MVIGDQTMLGVDQNPAELCRTAGRAMENGLRNSCTGKTVQRQALTDRYQDKSPKPGHNAREPEAECLGGTLEGALDSSSERHSPDKQEHSYVLRSWSALQLSRRGRLRGGISGQSRPRSAGCRTRGCSDACKSNIM